MGYHDTIDQATAALDERVESLYGWCATHAPFEPASLQYQQWVVASWVPWKEYWGSAAEWVVPDVLDRGQFEQLLNEHNAMAALLEPQGAPSSQMAHPDYPDPWYYTPTPHDDPQLSKPPILLLAAGGALALWLLLRR